MEQLKKERVKLLKELYENETMDIAVKVEDVTKEEVDHFLKYFNEYDTKPIVYLSIHGNAERFLVEQYKIQLEALNCVVRWYDIDVKKYDSYDVKNADIVLVFPHTITNLHVLGRGTETECKIAKKHGCELYAVVNTTEIAEILVIEKTVIDDNAQLDWLDTAKITKISHKNNLNDLVEVINNQLALNLRKIYIKNNTSPV